MLGLGLALRVLALAFAWPCRSSPWIEGPGLGLAGPVLGLDGPGLVSITEHL